MDRLTSTDASFLSNESPTSHMHIGGVTIFEGPPPTYEDLLDHIEGRLHFVPRYRQKLAFPPIETGRPFWVDDPQFNLGYHVRHSALPAPGGEDELRRMVARVFSQQLDRTKPLWELWLVEGLRKKRFALISKTHHALVDGVSAIDVGAVILDPDPEGTDLGLGGADWRPRAQRRTEEVLADRVLDARRLLLGIPREAARRALDPAAPQAALRTAQGFLDLARNTDPALPTLINEEIGRDRRVAFAATTLAAMKAAASARGATVNDAVLAVSAGALRRLFESRRAEIPDRFSALVPMSIRKPGEELALGNRITTLIVPLPLAERDPGERLRKIHATTSRLKESEAARAASLVIEASGWVPPTVSRVLGSIGAAGAGPVGRIVPQRLPWNLVISNVPGPPMPVYLLGRRLEAINPFVPLSPQRRALSIGVISYDGGLFFGLTGDRDRIPDLDAFAGFVATELAALTE
jgi:WS/DGAT/MGAT family acyltransferase